MNIKDTKFDGEAYECPTCHEYQLREMKICKGKPDTDEEWDDPEICFPTNEFTCDNCESSFSLTEGGELIGEVKNNDI